MIRGIIFLILSSVVLTLAEHCTCHKHLEPVYEQSQRDFITPATKNFDFSVRPNDCSDITRFYTDVSRPNNAFIRESSTPLIGGLIGTVTGLIADILRILDELLDRHAAFIWQSDIIHVSLDDLVDDLIAGLEGGCPDDPLYATHVVDQLLGFRAKKRELEHTKQYLEKSISAAQTRHEMLLAENSILGKCDQVSREIDSKQKNCKSGGGLLGGLLGGGNSCTRGSILDNALALVGNLLGSVVGLVKNLLDAIGIDILHFGDALTILKHELREISSIVGLFETVSVHDLTDNDIRQNHVYPVMERLQNHHYVPLAEVKLNLANILSNEQTTSQYISLPDELVKGFKFHNHHMSCRDENGEDISLNIDLNILNLLSVDACLSFELSCDLSLGIEVDLDLNDGISLHVGAQRWLDSLILVTKGITGCHHAETSIVRLHNGLLSAKLSILGQKNCAVNNALINLDVAANLNVGRILPSILLEVQQIVGGLVSLTDASSIRHAIQDTQYKIQEEYELGTELTQDIESLIVETVEASNNQVAAYNYGIDIIDRDDDPVKIATESVKILTQNANKNFKEVECAFENIQRSVHIAEARALSCQKELLQVELRRLGDPTNEDLIEICAALKLRLTENLNDILVLKQLYLSVKVDLELQASLLGGSLLKLCVDLDLKIKLLEKGVIRSVTDLLADLGVDLHAVLNPILHLVNGARNTISDLNIVPVVENLVPGTVKFVVTLVDGLLKGETVEHREHMHQKILKSAFAAGCQNPHVYVSENDVYKKRATGSSTCEYEVTITDGPGTNVARATEETGMEATTTTTSSASSLVCSFLVLFVSVLCFF